MNSKNIITLLIVSVFSISTMAQTTTVMPMDLKSQAIAESQLQGKQQKFATTTQVSSGMLTLKDPRPEVINRKFKYIAGLKAQSYSPKGIISTDMVGNLDLSTADSTIMPGFLIGINSSEFEINNLPEISYTIGMRADSEFASQPVKTIFKSGYTITDSRLNTSIIAAGPSLSFQLKNKPWIINPKLSLTAQYGTVTYTQTSANEFARFTRLAGLKAVMIDLDIPLTKNNSVYAGYSMRDLVDSETQLALQKDNLEVGTKVVW